MTKEERVAAHVFSCFLAYVLWKTLAQLCEQAGLGSEPRRVLQELKELCVVDVILQTKSGHEIRKRCITEPSEHQQILLDHLKLKLPKHLKMTNQKPETNVVKTFRHKPYKTSCSHSQLGKSV